MHFSWQGVMSFSETPMILFVLLVIFSHIIFYRYLRFTKLSIFSGNMAMAIGVVGMECLPQFDVPPFLMLVIALELVVIWFYLAIRFSQAYLDEELFFHSLTDCIGIGTWITGTVFTVLFVDDVEPTLHGFIVLLGLVAVILWIAYLAIVAKWLSFCMSKKLHVPANAMLMLAAVSTQSIALLLSALFHADMPKLIYQILISMGYIFYFMSLYMMLQHVMFAHPKHKAFAWFNVNYINHGAMSAAGLALLNTQVFPDWLEITTWWWAAISFFLVMLFECYRLVTRLNMKGFLRGIFAYDVTQWSRIFAYGIFYAFTFAYFHQEGSENILVRIIAEYGQYVVLFLFVVELLIVAIDVRKNLQYRKFVE